MLQISAAERAYVEEGVRVGVRADGRGRLDYRFFTLETGLITQANGMLVDHSKKKKGQENSIIANNTVEALNILCRRIREAATGNNGHFGGG